MRTVSGSEIVEALRAGAVLRYVVSTKPDLNLSVSILDTHSVNSRYLLNHEFISFHLSETEQQQLKRALSQPGVLCETVTTFDGDTEKRWYIPDALYRRQA